MKKYSLYIIVLFVAALIGGYFTKSYIQDRHDTIVNFKNNFIKDTYSKKKNEIEKSFTLIYQSLRTISLLPSIRQIPTSNRKSEKEDVIAEHRFTKEGSLTVQQLYNNLVSNVSISEIYAVMNGFDHSKGDIPFFMYDKIIISEGHAPEENEEKKTADTPEESEDSEYAYFPKMLKDLESSYPVLDVTKGLDSIGAISSSTMRTCDNDQYKSIKSGSASEAEGFVYAVPIFGYDNKFKGAITAIIRNNVLESQLIGVPKIIVTEQDQAEYQEKKWTLPKDPVHFILANSKNKTFLADRKLQLTDNDKTSVLKSILEQKTNADLYFEKLSLFDNSDWYLIYDFSAKPWSPNLDIINKNFQIKMIALLMITLTILAFLFNQNAQVHKVLFQVFQKLSAISFKLSHAGVEAQANGQELSRVTSSLSTVTTQIASAISEIESQAVQSVESTNDTKGISTKLSEEVSESQKHLCSLQEEMEKISASNKQVNELVHVINEINNKTKRIEDIVFKTQLLSFNASIEAARAGEHGRGFGVVSEEVGNLAHAIKKAAQEITTIIESSQSKASNIAEENNKCVVNGSQSVNYLTSVMATISEAAVKLTQTMDNMSDKTVQQLAGIKQITATILEIKRAMDSNNKLAETSLSLATNLKQQTDLQTEAIEQISKTFGLNHEFEKEKQAS